MRHFLTVCLLILATAGYSQFVTQGSATPIGPTCFRLNPDAQSQIGYVWLTNRIDLDQPFEISCQVFLGFNDGGADGVSIILQNMGTMATGVGAGGIGYQGMSPSLAIEFDTFVNGWDAPANGNDHIAVMANGIQDHLNPAGNLAGPVDILSTSGNAEDGQLHDVNIIWNPFVDSLKIYVDCDLRLQLQYDIVGNIFGGSSQVFVGAAGATGGARNQHQFCLNDIRFNLDTLYSCAGDTISLDAGPGTAFTWANSYNISSNNTKVTEVWPDVDTTYLVIATDSCGFPSRRLFTVITTDPSTIDPNLGSDFSFCQGDSVVYDLVRPEVSDYLWQDGSTSPSFTIDAAGIYWAELSNICGTQRDSVEASILLPPTVDLGPDDILCQGDSVSLSVPVPNATFTWQDNPVFSDSTFTVDGPGTYTVLVSNTCGSDSDTIIFEEALSPSFELGNDTTICDGTPLTLDASTVAGTNFLWQDGSTDSTFTVSQSGQYFVTASNSCGSFSDTIDVDFNLTPDIDLGNDTSFCQGNTLTLDATWTPGSSYIWQNGDTSSVVTATVSSLYEVIVVNSCGFDRDSVLIQVIEPPMGGFLAEEGLICDNEPDTLRTGFSGPSFDFQWQDNSTDSIFVATQEGFYFVRVSNECGSASDSTTLTASISPEVDLGDDFEVCEDQTIFLDAFWPDATYLWSDGLTTSNREVNVEGSFEVEVTNQCGTVSDSVRITHLFPPEPVDLGMDMTFCEGDSLVLDASQADIFPPVFYRWQDGSENPTYVVRRSSDISVVVSNECGEESDNSSYTFISTPTVNILGDSILCEGNDEEILLEARSNLTDIDLIWQNGSGEPFIEVTEPGLYFVTASNDCASGSDSLNIVSRFCECEIDAPTAFTPNDDGLNDDFQFFPNCDLREGSWAIYDRWGNKLFESSDINATWNGKNNNGTLVQEGVYVWVYEYNYLGEGEIQIKTESGTITVLR